MGGLIGVATDEKDGLLSSGVYRKLVFNGDTINSLNTSKTGIYQYNLPTDEGSPVPGWKWGTVAIFGGTWGTIQIATSTQTNNNHIYVRMGRTSDGVLEFTKWSTII